MTFFHFTALKIHTYVGTHVHMHVCVCKVVMCMYTVCTYIKIHTYVSGHHTHLWNQTDMDITEIVGSNFELELSECFNEGHTLNVTYGTSKLWWRRHRNNTSQHISHWWYSTYMRIIQLYFGHVLLCETWKRSREIVLYCNTCTCLYVHAVVYEHTYMQ